MQDGQRDRRVKFLAIQVSLYWPLFWALRFPKKIFLLSNFAGDVQASWLHEEERLFCINASDVKNQNRGFPI